jgi:hypothetical protein
VYVDSDILIWHLRNHPAATALLAHLPATGDEPWISAMQRVEITFFMRENEERRTLDFLAGFSLQPLTTEIIDLGSTLFRTWQPKNGLGREDALLAATAMLTGGRIVTQNVRHFPMPGVAVERGWP